MSEPGARAPIALLLGFAAFVVVLGYLIAASVVRPDVAEFAPTPPGLRPSGRPGPDTVTIDARDPARWQFYSLRRGAISSPDTADWDLAFRRFHVITSGSAADAGEVIFEQPRDTATAIFTETVFARDTVHPALSRWYRYGVVTHLLRPNGHVFLVRTRWAARIKLEFLSYYCPGAQPGCLTFRWAPLGP
ncbi:MAG: HmuY family protein [Gemmatimonadetes bacterium]|nr:HmuY family protein [Gemmatimonadota bacterium]